MLLKAVKMKLYMRISSQYAKRGAYYFDILKKMYKEIEENSEVTRSQAWVTKYTRTAHKSTYAYRKSNEYYLKSTEISESL